MQKRIDPEVTRLDDITSHQRDLRLMIRVSRLYHEQGWRQPAIAERLNISQPRVSRLLKQAVADGIVRTTVVSPPGVHADLEDALEQAYGLREAIVADTGDESDETQLTAALGSSAANHLDISLTRGEIIGISSWSSMLLATVDRMAARHSNYAESVVQVLGGTGHSSAQAHATRLIGRLARLTGARATYLTAPGLVASTKGREVLSRDSSIRQALDLCENLTVLLMGIGSVAPSELLRASGNAISPEEEESLHRLGAVGDVCLRFFDEHGKHVKSEFDRRVIGIAATDIKRVPRRIGVAGGDRKHAAIRAALIGGWINVLVTDLRTAEYLADSRPE